MTVRGDEGSSIACNSNRNLRPATDQKVLELEPENSEARDALRRTIAKINERGGEADPDRAAHAMADPEIQAILRDPMVRVFVCLWLHDALP